MGCMAMTGAVRTIQSQHLQMQAPYSWGRALGAHSNFLTPPNTDARDSRPDRQPDLEMLLSNASLLLLPYGKRRLFVFKTCEALV